jgi:chromosome segregation ATPase
MDVIASHIKKEAYLHHRLTSEMTLRKTMTMKLLEENSNIKAKSKRVIELLSDKLSRAESNVALYRRRMTALEERLKASSHRDRATTNATNGEAERKAMSDIDMQLPRRITSPYKSPVALHSCGGPSSTSTQISKSISSVTDMKQSNLVQSIDNYEWQERNIDEVEEELQSLSAAKRTISKLTAVINDLSLRRSDPLSMSMVETSHLVVEEEELLEEQQEDQPNEDNRLDLTECIRELDAYDLVVSDASSPHKNTNPNTTNISSEMEHDIAGIALGMELTHYKSMVADLTAEMETMREESKVRAMQSIERIKQLKSKLSTSSQALVEADHRIASLEHELVEKSQAMEHYRDAMYRYESELEEVRSAATAHHSEIERLREQMQMERGHFIKLRKSLSRLDSLQTWVFSSSAQSSSTSTAHNLPTDQIKEIYHLGCE